MEKTEWITKAIDWGIVLIVGCVPIWLFYKSKKETKKIEKRLEEEIIARKDLEKKVIEENAKGLNSLYYKERERSENCYKRLKEETEKSDKLINSLWEKERKLEIEISNLRSQLWKKGVPWEEHDISDENQQQEAIVEVKGRWGARQDKNEKINELTINEMLGNWENSLKNKKGEGIIKEKRRLLKKIEEEAKLVKK